MAGAMPIWLAGLFLLSCPSAAAVARSLHPTREHANRHNGQGPEPPATWPWPEPGTNPSLGAHRALITLPQSLAVPPGGAVWVDIPWRRRAWPPANATDCVLTTARDASRRIANIIRAPAAGNVDAAEGLGFVFEPSAQAAQDWIPNTGTAQHSILVNCTGSDGPNNPCWKAVDGLLEFSYSGAGEGWNGLGGVETLNMDLGPSASDNVTGFGIWTVARAEDQHFPVHSPRRVAMWAAKQPSGPWEEILSNTSIRVPVDDTTGIIQFNFTRSLDTSTYRYFRLSILCRYNQATPSNPAGDGGGCVSSASHSWIKEVQFGRETSAKPQLERDYALYYMPYSYSGGRTGLSIHTKYDAVNNTASPTWLSGNNLSAQALASGAFRQRLPSTANVTVEARDTFESFAPMELTATAAERSDLLSNRSQDVLFFPEERLFPVRMGEQPPAKWMSTPASSRLEGVAQPGEVYALQLGIWAARKALSLSPATVSWSDMQADGDSDEVIAKEAISCPNIGGVDYLGEAFTQEKTIPVGGVNSLWLLVPIPAKPTATAFRGTLTVGTEGKFDVVISVNQTAREPIPNQGADDLWRMSRLSWLNSQLGIDQSVTRPYTAIAVTKDSDGLTVAIGQHKRSLRFRGEASTASFPVVDGINVSTSPSVSVLSTQPLSLGLQTSAGPATFKSGPPMLTASTTPAAATVFRNATSSCGVAVNASVLVNYDGYVEVKLGLSAEADIPVRLENMTVSWEMDAGVAVYAMGLGAQGRRRADNYSQGLYFNWTHAATYGRHQLWVGRHDAGLRAKWKGASNDWNSPLHCVSELPNWAGLSQQSGGISMSPEREGKVTVTAFTGPIVVDTAGSLFHMDLLVTPVKELNISQHFRRDRYYQYGYNGEDSPDKIAAMGVKVLNLHQGVDTNPFINYPFDPVASLKMKNFSDTAKSFGVESTCIYYTTRELSNRCYELPTLRLLGTDADHVFDNGTGGGAPWLQEHLQGGYVQRWSTGLSDHELDAAIGDTTLSRWVNYYVQGLAWLRANGPKIDGLYLDELSFGRGTMQRMRKAADVKEGALFDLHSCNKFHCGIPPTAPHSSSMLIYMAHFAYLDSLWFGEGFDPDESPEYWLVEMSGIPFGIPAEQLTRPNLWRGMLFAEGARPAPDLWRAWDEMGLTMPGTKLKGWWDDGSLATTSSDNVRCSVYSIPGKNGPSFVLAIASWHPKSIVVAVTLAASMPKVTAAAPNITGFQPAMTTVDLNAVAVEPGKGWLLSLHPVN